MDLARQQRQPANTRQQVADLAGMVHPPGGRSCAAAGHSAAHAPISGWPTGMPCFTNGTLTTTLPPRHRTDCHIGGDPAAILLVVYRRRSPWRAAMTGRVIAWGRQPWLALSLADRFCPP